MLNYFKAFHLAFNELIWLYLVVMLTTSYTVIDDNIVNMMTFRFNDLEGIFIDIW